MRKYLLVIFMFQTAFVNAQTFIETRLGMIMEEFDAVGLGISVVRNNKIVYTHSFGLKNIETKSKMMDEDVYRIASISKSFLATSIKQLVEKKKLSLDNDVSELIGFTVRNPQYPDKVITLKMLLSHSSSINDSQGYFELDAINPIKNREAGKCYSNNEPGSTYDYCNLNFNMAGAIVERVTGIRYDQYVAGHIIKPLGLYGGYCVDSLDQSKLIMLYDRDSIGKMIFSENAYNNRRTELSNYTLGYSTPVLSPTGGMKISARDLAQYMMMHMNYGKLNGARIIKKKSARLMQSIISPQGEYGLALLTTDKLVPGITLKGHTGSAYGLYSMMFFDPEKKNGIVVITNGCRAVMDGAYNAMLKKCINFLWENIIQFKVK